MAVEHGWLNDSVEVVAAVSMARKQEPDSVFHNPRDQAVEVSWDDDKVIVCLKVPVCGQCDASDCHVCPVLEEYAKALRKMIREEA